MHASESGVSTQPRNATHVHAGGAEGRRVPRLLYLYPETMGLSPDAFKNPLHYLSRHLQGDYVAVWVVNDAATARRKALEGRDANGRFRFHWTRIHPIPFGLRRVWELMFWIGKGVLLSAKHGRYDVVVVYGAYSTALAGLAVRLLTGARLIVEFPGHPFRTYDLYPGWTYRVKRWLAPHWTRYIASTADHVRLLFPTQIDDLDIDVRAKASVFHNFTRLTTVRDEHDSGASDEKYVLFLGFPFHLKGVDVLIRAFNLISKDFPDHRLLIVGHCPDPAPYHALTEGNPRIEIRKPVPHDDAMRLIAHCSVFVLASRIEGMARVLLEAMGAGRPVISSAVGGIPFYIDHGRTGLLFESENVQELAAHLTRLLSDPEFARALGERARAHVAENLTEERYAEQFRQMVDRVMSA
jgi:glycosyltransferase involved in cell wall biosynthesis